MNQQNPVPDMIREYAQLQHKSEIYQAHGQAVPANIALRMSALLAWGRAHINPNSFPVLVQEVNAIVANLHMQTGGIEQQQSASSNKQLLDNAVGKLTKGMLGQDRMTANQLSAIVNKQPLRARIPNKRPTQAQRDAEVRAITRQYDPKGIGLGEKDFMRLMDQFTDADPEEFAKLCFKYKVDPSDARRGCSQWKTARVEIAVKQRHIDRHEHKYGKSDTTMLNKEDREVPDHEHRKATLATAMLADSIDQSERGDSENFNGLAERSDIHPSYLEDTGRRGDLARSFEKVESLGYDG